MVATNRIAVLLTVMTILFAVQQSLAQGQFQANNRFQTGIPGAAGVGADNNQFGNSQNGFGRQGGFGQNQFGQQGQPGAFGQGGLQQAAPGSAEAMRNAFQNMSGRQRRRATFDFVVESLNEMRDQRRERRERRRRPDAIRIRIRPAFTVAPVDATQLGADLKDNLDKSIELQGSSAVADVTLEGGRATLTGTVADDHEGAVLARMLSMQPGVSDVDNQLVVQSLQTEAPSSPEPVLPGAAER